MKESATLLLSTNVIISDFGTQLSYNWTISVNEIKYVYEHLHLLQNHLLNEVSLKFLNHKLKFIENKESVFDLDVKQDISLFNIDKHSLDYILKFLSNHLNKRNEVDHVDVDFTYNDERHVTLTIKCER